ncbi:MAG: nitrogenase component 1 [Phascolarctobacterium sp.]|nr:nitrogenase component 1 [Phascolarctobacterium sp.]
MYSNNQCGNICHRVDTCALSGAATFVAGIPGAEVLVNGPLWCYFYALRNLEHAKYDMGERFHDCQPDNNAIVYGTEKFLTATLQRLLDSGRKPSLLLVESSCSLSLIGDDLAGIVRKMDLPYPFVTMDCGGLVGGFAEGYTKAALAVIDKFAKEQEQVEPEQKGVNLLGLNDFYYNGVADRKELCCLLEKAGYKINAVPGGGSSLEELQQLGKAQLNIVCNEELGLKIAQHLEKRFGTPYLVAGLPYGLQGTQKWLRKINEVLPCSHLQVVLDECEQQAERLNALGNDYRGLWGSIWFDKVVIAANGTQALCMGQAVRNEWADMGELIVICQHDVQNTYCHMADEVLLAGRDAIKIEGILQNVEDVLLLGSSSEASTLRRRGARFTSCTIAYPAAEEVLLTETPFVGIRGAAHMLQKLWNVYIRSVLDKQVSK